MDRWQTWLLFGAIAVASTIVSLFVGRIRAANDRKEFAGDPLQQRLATHVEAYAHSRQDDAAYTIFAEAVRREFDTIGVASKERVLQRLMHAGTLVTDNHNRGLRQKPTPSQTRRTAEAMIRISEDL